MNCRRAQSEFSRSLDEAAPLSSEAEHHLSTCEDCGSFRDATVAVERRYRGQVRAGIDRLRRLDRPSFRPRPASRPRLWIPVAAALLIWGWGWATWKPSVQPSTPQPVAVRTEPKPVRRTMLFEDVGLLDRIGPELSFLQVGEPRLPHRLDQELLSIRMTEPEIALPRNLRF